MTKKPVLLRITTVPISLHLLLKGQFRYMVGQGFEVYTCSAAGQEVDEVLKEGVQHFIIPFTRKITPWQDLKCLYQLVRLIRKLRPAIVHTHTPKAGLLGMMAAWICRVPVRIHTVAGLPLMEATGTKRRVLELTEKLTYACAVGVYPNAAGLRTFMVDTLQVSPRKIAIIGKGSSNGIDAAFFNRTPELEQQARTLRQDHNIGADDIVFSFVGRIVRDKGIVELATAFQALKSRTTRRLFLVLVGPFEQDLDPLPPEVLAFLQGDATVVLPGFQRDVRPWLVASDIFTFPSYREGFPNVVMQAALLGVPVVVSDINGCNEIIQRNITGLIVPPKNAAALEEAMLMLVNDTGKRKTFAQAAQRFVSTHFDRQYVWAELKAEYDRLLKQRL